MGELPDRRALRAAPVPALAAALMAWFPASVPALEFTKVGEGPHVTDGHSSRAVTWIDFDADGDLDLYVTNGGLPGEDNDLYRNDGAGGFASVTGLALVDDSLRDDGATWGDWDGDGDPDLFVASWWNETNALFENLGGGAFQRVTTGPAVVTSTYSEGCAWADPDADGDLDLFVAGSGNGGGETNRFYRNDAGSLVEVLDLPIVGDSATSRQGSWADFDDDGDLDLFVANENGEDNFLFRNLLADGGTFGFEADTTSPVATDGGSSLSGSWADFDGDGDLDLFVGNFEGQPGFLYRNRLAETGSATFERILDQDPALDGGWSIGTHWGDLDDDGDVDLFVTNGYAAASFTTRRNFLYRNDGGTLVRVLDGDIANDRGWSYAAALGDADDDGDLDVYVANWHRNDQPNFFYRNEAQASGNAWLRVRLAGTVSNRSGIGATVRAVAAIGGTATSQRRQVSGSDGYCSQNLEVHFGLGDASVVDTLEVRWPSGIVQTLVGVAPGQRLDLVEPAATDAGERREAAGGGTHGLLGSAPNPFRTGTAVRWEQSAAGRAVLTVHDALGRRVRGLHDGPRGAGAHVVAWDGRDDGGRPVPSGVYFLRLAAEGTTGTVRALRLR